MIICLSDSYSGKIAAGFQYVLANFGTFQLIFGNFQLILAHPYLCKSMSSIDIVTSDLWDLLLEDPDTEDYTYIKVGI